MLQEFYEKDWIRIEIRKPPLCAAVVSSTCENACWCLRNALSFLKQFEDKPLDEEIKRQLTSKKIVFLDTEKEREGKIQINSCRKDWYWWLFAKWDIALCITLDNNELITPEIINSNSTTIHTIIKQILAESDEWHILHGSRDQELKWSEKDNGYLLTLHRWIPKQWLQKIDAILPKD
jgi:hypothetical protein